MLLTVDLGNTSLKLGVFDKKRLVCFTNIDSYPNEFAAIIKNHLYRNGLKEDMLDDAIVSSVVPNVTEQLLSDIKSLIGKDAYVIDPRHSYGIKIDTPNINEVGSDLLVMCAYAYNKFRSELFVISIGTATVISHVTIDGAFKHCVIAPGYSKIAETLWGNAAKLPEFELKKTHTFVANTTVDAMNVGIYQGYIGSVRYLLRGMKKELNAEPLVIACGGFGKEVVRDIPEVKYYEADMVTTGLNFIYNRYIKNDINFG